MVVIPKLFSEVGSKGLALHDTCCLGYDMPKLWFTEHLSSLGLVTLFKMHFPIFRPEFKFMNIVLEQMQVLSCASRC